MGKVSCTGSASRKVAKQNVSIWETKKPPHDGATLKFLPLSVLALKRPMLLSLDRQLRQTHLAR